MHKRAAKNEVILLFSTKCSLLKIAMLITHVTSKELMLNIVQGYLSTLRSLRLHNVYRGLL